MQMLLMQNQTAKATNTLLKIGNTKCYTEKFDSFLRKRKPWLKSYSIYLNEKLSIKIK